MRVNDLMLGDWVRNTNGNVGRVAGITEDGAEVIVHYTDNGTAFSDPGLLRPVRLLLGMLAENGWEVHDKMYAELAYEEGRRLSWYQYEGILRDWYTGRDGVDREIFLSRPGLIYVHQMQHALRMCGIEKEILL